MGLKLFIAKTLTFLVIVFIVVANVMAPPAVRLTAPSGPERFLVIPVKFVEYRFNGSSHIPESPYPHFGFNLSGPLKEVPIWEFNAKELLINVDSSYVQNYIKRTINNARERIISAGYSPTPALLRGTTFMVMWSSGLMYDNIGGTHLPSQTISEGGDCDDWTMVRWAILRQINRYFGIDAEYFMVIVPGHAFLAVYYPKFKSWELYDWFAVRNIFVVRSGVCPYCVAKPISFPDLKTALTAYYLGSRNIPLWGNILKKNDRIQLYMLPKNSPSIYYVNLTGKMGISPFEPTYDDEARARLIVSLAWKNVTVGGRPENGTYLVKISVDGKLMNTENVHAKNGTILLNLNVTGMLSPVVVREDGGYFTFVKPEEVQLKAWKKPGMIGNWLAFGWAKVILKSSTLTLLLSTSDYSKIEMECPFGKKIQIEIIRI